MFNVNRIVERKEKIMKFPVKEAEVMLLAEKMATGFATNTTFFAAPPVPVEDFKGALTNCTLSINNVVAARAIYDKAVVSKKLDYDKLIDIMKKELRYAENTATGDEAMLAAIGWSKKRTATPSSMPGACYDLNIEDEGQGWISLSWKKSDQGGKPSAYTVERRVKGGDWEEIASITEKKKDLVAQPQGMLLYYRVIGFNKAGRSAPSNTVDATL